MVRRKRGFIAQPPPDWFRAWLSTAILMRVGARKGLWEGTIASMTLCDRGDFLRGWPWMYRDDREFIIMMWLNIPASSSSRHKVTLAPHVNVPELKLAKGGCTEEGQPHVGLGSRGRGGEHNLNDGRRMRPSTLAASAWSTWVKSLNDHLLQHTLSLTSPPNRCGGDNPRLFWLVCGRNIDEMWQTSAREAHLKGKGSSIASSPEPSVGVGTPRFAVSVVHSWRRMFDGFCPVGSSAARGAIAGAGARPSGWMARICAAVGKFRPWLIGPVVARAALNSGPSACPFDLLVNALAANSWRWCTNRNGGTGVDRARITKVKCGVADARAAVSMRDLVKSQMRAKLCFEMTLQYPVLLSHSLSGFHYPSACRPSPGETIVDCIKIAWWWRARGVSVLDDLAGVLCPRRTPAANAAVARRARFARSPMSRRLCTPPAVKQPSMESSMSRVSSSRASSLPERILTWRDSPNICGVGRAQVSGWHWERMLEGGRRGQAGLRRVVYKATDVDMVPTICLLCEPRVIVMRQTRMRQSLLNLNHYHPRHLPLPHPFPSMTLAASRPTSMTSRHDKLQRNAQAVNDDPKRRRQRRRRRKVVVVVERSYNNNDLIAHPSVPHALRKTDHQRRPTHNPPIHREGSVTIPQTDDEICGPLMGASQDGGEGKNAVATDEKTMASSPKLRIHRNKDWVSQPPRAPYPPPWSRQSNTSTPHHYPPSVVVKRELLIPTPRHLELDNARHRVHDPKRREHVVLVPSIAYCIRSHDINKTLDGALWAGKTQVQGYVVPGTISNLLAQVLKRTSPSPAPHLWHRHRHRLEHQHQHQQSSLAPPPPAPCALQTEQRQVILPNTPPPQRPPQRLDCVQLARPHMRPSRYLRPSSQVHRCEYKATRTPAGQQASQNSQTTLTDGTRSASPPPETDSGLAAGRLEANRRFRKAFNECYRHLESSRPRQTCDETHSRVVAGTSRVWAGIRATAQRDDDGECQKCGHRDPEQPRATTTIRGDVLRQRDSSLCVLTGRMGHPYGQVRKRLGSGRSSSLLHRMHRFALHDLFITIPERSRTLYSTLYPSSRLHPALFASVEQEPRTASLDSKRSAKVSTLERGPEPCGYPRTPKITTSSVQRNSHLTAAMHDNLEHGQGLNDTALGRVTNRVLCSPPRNVQIFTLEKWVDENICNDSEKKAAYRARKRRDSGNLTRRSVQSVRTVNGFKALSNY
ncbi:hypothetical protein DFP72DRAFT_850706 [Ephemerocybe angulata]|uniref:Uncharacterized protein n=1 Tax=Ephemerocybe angulata TaxID=980116 RepID=A0A8H6HRX5_9AGAR|nr:hypothetical protein DFP72DRAFT_850706 [Tulosesus angulatus]